VTAERQVFADGNVQHGVVVHPDGNIDFERVEIKGQGDYVIPCDRKFGLYPSEARAKQALTDMLRRLGHNSTRLRAYQCPHDRSHWHLGKVTEKVAERAAAAGKK